LVAPIREARSLYPSLAVSDDEFAGFLAHRLDNGELDDEAAIRNAGDLLLACAVLAGAPGAVELLDRNVLGTLDVNIGKIVGASSVDEVKQRVREILLVSPPGATAGLVRYAGRGPLRAWVRSVAIRTAIKLRDEQPNGGAQDFEILGLSDDPALRILHEHHAHEFRKAYEVALRALAPRDRTLLRQQFVDGLGMDALAALHRVHRVTMYRRMGKIRREVLSKLRRELAQRVSMKHSELDSLMRAFHSNIELTLERVLASESE
jgi:RNA polymerase sigma-70 factor (ECF subfamily)